MRLFLPSTKLKDPIQKNKLKEGRFKRGPGPRTGLELHLGGPRIYLFLCTDQAEPMGPSCLPTSPDISPICGSKTKLVLYRHILSTKVDLLFPSTMCDHFASKLIDKPSIIVHG